MDQVEAGGADGHTREDLAEHRGQPELLGEFSRALRRGEDDEEIEEEACEVDALAGGDHVGSLASSASAAGTACSANIQPRLRTVTTESAPS